MRDASPICGGVLPRLSTSLSFVDADTLMSQLNARRSIGTAPTWNSHPVFRTAPMFVSCRVTMPYDGGMMALISASLVFLL